MVLQESTARATSSSSIKEVTYSCGYCGYALNLRSSDRNTSSIGSKYGKAIKKGLVPFVAVDESRFTLSDEVSCLPYFHSNHSWGLFRRTTRLLCRKCGGRVGSAYGGAEDCGRRPRPAGDLAPPQKKYVIQISALQPSSDESEATALSA